MGTLGIEDAHQFYSKILVEDFDEYCRTPNSPRHAMHCAIAAYHMADWVWADWLKKDHICRKNMGIGKENAEFLAWINDKCPWFRIVQDIANGSKHFSSHNSVNIASATHPARISAESYLVVDWGEALHDGERFQSVGAFLEVVVRFWRDFLKLYRPNPNRRDSQFHSS